MGLENFSQKFPDWKGRTPESLRVGLSFRPSKWRKLLAMYRLRLTCSWFRVEYGIGLEPEDGSQALVGRRVRAAMLFSGRLSERKVLKSADRLILLETLIGDFVKAFPDLKFELQLDFAVINAQAIALGDKRIVAIYGGLALHPKLGAEALTFIILHEAGHHLAKGCRSKRDRSLACECASDHWAVTVGADTLLEKSGRRLRLRAAVAELDQVMSPRQPPKDGYTKKASTSGCWAKGWSLRRRALFDLAQPPMIEGHCITYIC
jgi:hypothetical protein